MTTATWSALHTRYVFGAGATSNDKQDQLSVIGEENGARCLRRWPNVLPILFAFVQIELVHILPISGCIAIEEIAEAGGGVDANSQSAGRGSGLSPLAYARA